MWSNRSSVVILVLPKQTSSFMYTVQRSLHDSSHAGAYQGLMKSWADMNTKLGIGSGDDFGFNHKRQFLVFLQDWEEPAVESRDPNFSQRRLEKKYRGLYIFDKKVGEEQCCPLIMPKSLECGSTLVARVVFVGLLDGEFRLLRSSVAKMAYCVLMS